MVMVSNMVSIRVRDGFGFEFLGSSVNIIRSVRTIPVSGIGRYQLVSVSADTPIILACDTDTSEQQCVWPRGLQWGGGYGYSAGPAGAPRGLFRSIRGIRGLRY